MNNVVSFTDKKKGKDQDTTYKQPKLPVGSLRYAEKRYMPDDEDNNTLIFTKDTGELFIGGGTGVKIKKISDVNMFDSANDFPIPGVIDKIYVSKKDKALFFWTDGQYNIASAAGSAEIVIAPKVNEYDLEKDLPAEGKAGAIYIVKDKNTILRYDADQKKYVPLCSQGTDTALTARVEGIEKNIKDNVLSKIEKTEVSVAKTADDVAKMSTKIEDIAKQQAPKFDDSALKAEDKRLDDVKADKTAIAAIEKKATDAEATATAAKTSAEEAKTAIQNAETKADAAKIAADAAKSTADTVSATAAAAKTAADEAKIAAETAKTTANDAKTTADTIKATADTAKATAEAAKTAADTAKTVAEDAKAAANAVATDVVTAKQDASDAKIIANSAAKNAADATLALNSWKSKVSTDLGDFREQLEEIRKATLSNITEIPTYEKKPVAYNTELTALGLPTKISATLEDGTHKDIEVAWESTAYDKNKVGDQSIFGTLNLPKGITNTKKLRPEFPVIVGSNPAESNKYEWSHYFLLPMLAADVPNFQKRLGEKFTIEEFEGVGINDETNNDFESMAAKRKVELRFIGTTTQKYPKDDVLPTDPLIMDADVDLVNCPHQFAVSEKYKDGLRVPVETNSKEFAENYKKKVAALGDLVFSNGSVHMYFETDKLQFTGGYPTQGVYLIRKIKEGYLPYPEAE